MYPVILTTIKWPPGVSALDVSVVPPHEEETPSGQKIVVLSALYTK